MFIDKNNQIYLYIIFSNFVCDLGLGKSRIKTFTHFTKEKKIL